MGYSIFYPSLQFCFWGSLVAFGVIIWRTWRRDRHSVGLPICYMLSLASIHLVGAWIYTLPQYENSTTPLVEIGFRECFFGILAFLSGLRLAEYLLFKKHNPATGRKRVLALPRDRGGPQTALPIPRPVLLPSSARERPRATRNPNTRRSRVQSALNDPVAISYIVLGLLSLVIIIPVLQAIPSIGAVANSGPYLIVAGFCLACYHAHATGRRRLLWFWLALTLIFPMFTIIFLGHIFYGIMAMAIVYAFAFVFFRPRWQAVLISVVAVYLGLSVYVTYMRDRDELRATVWGGDSFSNRVGKFGEMFGKFEWFQSDKVEHLQAIDDRLNQNYLVGVAVANFLMNLTQHAHGETFVEAVQSLVPRILWPNKPVRAGSPEIVSRYTGLVFDEETSIGVGQVMEFYINFGRWGVVWGFFCFGLIIRWIDWNAAHNLYQGNGPGFVAWFLPGLAFLQVGGSLVEVTGTAATAIVLTVVVNKVIMPVVQESSGVRPKERKPVRV